MFPNLQNTAKIDQLQSLTKDLESNVQKMTTEVSMLRYRINESKEKITQKFLNISADLSELDRCKREIFMLRTKLEESTNLNAEMVQSAQSLEGKVQIQPTVTTQMSSPIREVSQKNSVPVHQIKPVADIPVQSQTIPPIQPLPPCRLTQVILSMNDQVLAGYLLSCFHPREVMHLGMVRLNFFKNETHTSTDE